ncbi:hypothetical protein PN36_00350 [Candidatus Thiomargarita nelsonii]|uniref:Uncharacterized protein n=1 Tax=Candidatus Thiomargarita nelsonii TaxID=1003181 RepID=A0A0A6PEK3_9GAMM|nr:hypothetical protein PN36_00350 [Candidatus Thiomargarita nelsonii]
MAIETSLVNSIPSGLSAGSFKAFLMVHPVGVAVAGGALVGMGTYYLMNKFFKKKKEPAVA